jgi:hypothetical protein
MFSARNASPGQRFRNSAGSATASYFGSAAPAPAAEIVNGVADRVRAEMYHNIGLADLLARCPCRLIHNTADFHA